MTEWMFDRSEGDELIIELAWFMKDLAEKDLGFINWTNMAKALYDAGYILDGEEIEYEDV